jgi:hypothetical protein
LGSFQSLSFQLCWVTSPWYERKAQVNDLRKKKQLRDLRTFIYVAERLQQMKKTFARLLLSHFA